MDAKNTIQGQWGELEFIQTDDGSYTIKSSYYDEACHSLDGAKDETVYNFIEGCQLEARLNRYHPLVIFETGLGMGYGLDCSLELIDQRPLLFISTEIEPKLIEYSRETKNHLLWKGLEQDEKGHYVATNGQQKFIILVGDATKTIKDLPHYLGQLKFHAIFQDAFSPKKNPELWDQIWFESLKTHADDECILSTYCASRSPREAMVQAGWKIQDRKGFGRKRLSTVATIK